MKITYDQDHVRLYTGDSCEVLASLPSGSVGAVVTSPPYWRQRDYGIEGQYGLEDTIGEYVSQMVTVFGELRRVLTPAATVWLNLADSYLSGPIQPSGNPGNLNGRPNCATTPSIPGGRRGLPAKNLAGIPWRVALALQEQLGYWLRADVIWHKPNAMPESVRDRPSRKHEYLFLFTPSRRYHFDLDLIRQPAQDIHRPQHARVARSGRAPCRPRKHAHASALPPGRSDIQTLNVASSIRPAAHPSGPNPGTVWRIPTRPSLHCHYAAFPIDIPLRCIAAGCPPGETVLDPFSGSGTTILAARQLGHPGVGIDLNPAYHDITIQRLHARDNQSRRKRRSS